VILFSLALLPIAAQSQSTKENSVSDASTQVQPASLAQAVQEAQQAAQALGAPAQQAAVAGQQAKAAGQPVSQPGAVGQTMPVAQPPVPVPSGPVPPQEIKPAPPTPIAVKKVELGSENTWDPKWDVQIEENLPPELMTPGMAKAVRPFCPHFGQLNQADKRAFWAYLFQALAGAEAGLRPTADVKHLDPTVAVRDKVSRRTVRQQGLLQLTYEDNQRYGCDFDWENDRKLPAGDPGKTILQPEKNLACGIRIMKNQLVDLNRPLVTRKSYWGTLRPGTASYKVFAKQMANVPMACGAKTGLRDRPVAGDLHEASAPRSVSGQAATGGQE
jgi:hypothetical protein